jgi:hypothetical protein
MSYAQGSTIDAADYNGLVGSNSTTAGTLNYVWNTGNGAFGYGQGAIAAVTAPGTITATQWSTMLNALNRSLQHQSGAGATLGPVNYTAGSTITFFSNVNTSITTINTNKALFTAQGGTTTGSNFDETVNTSGALSNAVYGARTVTFATANAARYFFNAGGRLNYFVSTPTAAGSGRNANFVGLIGGLGGWGQLNTTSSGRTGTGQTVNTNSTTFGYRNNVLNTWTSVVAITSTAASYTSDTAAIQVQTNSSDTTDGSNGLTVQFRSLYNVGDKTWDDTINVTHRTRVDIVFPETTYLSSSPWGTPVVS